MWIYQGGHHSVYRIVPFTFYLKDILGVCVCVFILKQRRMKYGAFGAFVRSREKSVCKTNIFSLIIFQNPFYFWCLWVETTRRYYYSWDFFTDNEMAYIWEPFHSRDSIAYSIAVKWSDTKTLLWKFRSISWIQLSLNQLGVSHRKWYTDNKKFNTDIVICRLKIVIHFSRSTWRYCDFRGC